MISWQDSFKLILNFSTGECIATNEGEYINSKLATVYKSRLGKQESQPFHGGDISTKAIHIILYKMWILHMIILDLESLYINFRNLIDWEVSEIE